MLLAVRITFGESPFNGLYCMNDLNVIILKVSANRMLPSEIAKAAKKEPPEKPELSKDTISKTIPSLSGGFGLMRLLDRWLILAAEVYTRCKIQNTYIGEKTKTKIKDNRFMVGGGIKVGILLSGKAFAYLGAYLTNCSISVKSSDTEEDKMDQFHGSGVAPAFRIGAVAAINNRLYLDVHVLMSKKTFRGPMHQLVVKHNSKIIGVSLIYRVLRSRM